MASPLVKWGSQGKREPQTLTGAAVHEHQDGDPRLLLAAHCGVQCRVARMPGVIFPTRAALRC